MTVAQHWVLEGEQRGLQQGIQQGVKAGRAEVLLRLLRRKFGPLSAITIAKLQEIKSEAQLDDLAEQLLVADSLDELGLT